MYRRMDWKRKGKPWSSRRAMFCASHLSGHTSIEGSDVLCVGCGDGEECLVWKQAGARSVTGTDIRDHGKGSCDKFFRSDFMKGIMQDKRYDIVYSSEVIEDLPWREPYLSDCARLAKPGGFLVMTTDNPMQLRTLFRFFSQNSDIFHHEGHHQFYSPRDLSRLLREKGFSVLKTRNIGRYHFASLGRVYMIIARKRSSRQ